MAKIKPQPEKNTQAVPFPDELDHLEQTRQKLADALVAAENAVNQLDQDYNEAKRYMVQNRGDIDPHEMFQNELTLREIDSSGAFAVERRARIEKLRDSPYFARIDFGGRDEAPAPYYIGRFAFSDEGEPLIFDWRAPVAGLFYDGVLGPASYEAPRGRVEGRLTRRRQFKIKDGVMEYALESADNVGDEVLQRELARTTDEGMKSIIATIQKEQNAIIRSEGARTLVIQGAAGSGKTSIALHRVAFLMYRHKGRLKALDIAILSPNRVFGHYISGVLPELGEQPIFELGLADIATVQLEKVIAFAPKQGSLEGGDGAVAERLRAKATAGFVGLMDQYIESLPETAFEARDYRTEDFSFPAAWIRGRLAAYHRYPLLAGLAQVAEDIHDHLETRNVRGHEPPRPRAILKELKTMLRFKSTLALYRDFLKWAGMQKQFRLAGKNTLEWGDVFPFLYLHGAFAGLVGSGVIKHLVIDEMQDYSPIQLAVLQKLFGCPKTILGDFDQAIDPDRRHTLEEMLALFPGVEFVRLTTSYRSSFEILRFAKKLCPGAEVEAVRRHGQAPALLACEDEEAQRAAVARLVEDFRAEAGGTMGLILKTDALARLWFKALEPLGGLHLITPESKRFEGGVSVTSVRLAKGLEFDEVVLPGVGAGAYHTDHDRRLLYVACTRALHRLTLLWAGAPSPLLGR